MFAEPLLAAHDRSNVELYLYAGVTAEDAATERFESVVHTIVDGIGVRTSGKQPDWKKAIVTLAPGQKIELGGVNYFEQ